MTLIHADGPAPAVGRASVRIARPGQGTGGTAWGREQSIARFWSHVDKSAGPDGCWLWTASTNKDGYGKWGSPYWPGQYAHRIAFLIDGGRIPKGREIDHECHNRAGADCPLFHGGSCPHRACVNPAHLAVKTVAENRRSRPAPPRRTHCPANHPFSEANTYINPRGGQVCRECVRAALRRSHLKHREKRNAERAARRKAAA